MVCLLQFACGIARWQMWQCGMVLYRSIAYPDQARCVGQILSPIWKERLLAYRLPVKPYSSVMFLNSISSLAKRSICSQQFKCAWATCKYWETWRCTMGRSLMPPWWYECCLFMTVLAYCLIALLCAPLMAVYLDNNCKDRAKEAVLTLFLHQWVRLCLNQNKPCLKQKCLNIFLNWLLMWD